MGQAQWKPTSLVRRVSPPPIQGGVWCSAILRIEVHEGRGEHGECGTCQRLIFGIPVNFVDLLLGLPEEQVRTDGSSENGHDGGM